MTRSEREAAALATLAAHNPVPNVVRIGEPSAAAVALLERILSTDPAPDVGAPVPRRRVVVAGAVTAAAAAVAVAATAILPGGTGPAGPSPAAAAVLRQAAAGAANAPRLAPGAYLLTTAKTRDLQVVSCLLPDECDKGHLRPGETVHAYSVDGVVQTWVDAYGAGRYRSVSSPLVLSPDVAAYFRQANQRVPVTPRVLDQSLAAAPGINAGDPRGWPTDPKALAAAITGRFEGGSSNDYATGDLVFQLLETATDPGLRSALYAVLAGTPGITSAGARRDRDGRSGESLGVTHDGVQISWLLDVSTGELLERTATLTDPQADPGPAFQSLAAGTQLSVWTFSQPRTVSSQQSP